MNRMLKAGFVALAMAAAVPAFAQEEEIANEGPVGWSPVAIGLATPVQVPWGLNTWDVFGLDVNVFYSDTPLMYGLNVGGLGALNRNDLIGLQVGGLMNVSCEDVYALRATLGVNFFGQSVYGADIAGLVGFGDKLWGLEIAGLGTAQHDVCGLAIGGLANVTDHESYGCTIAGLTNLARISYGLQLSCLFNMTEELHGCQLGLVNYTKACPSGFQIGLVNIIRENVWPVLPIVNASF